MGAAKLRKADIAELKKTPKPQRMGKQEVRAKVATAMVDVLGNALRPLLKK